MSEVVSPIVITPINGEEKHSIRTVKADTVFFTLPAAVESILLQGD